MRIGFHLQACLALALFLVVSRIGLAATADRLNQALLSYNTWTFDSQSSSAQDPKTPPSAPRRPQATPRPAAAKQPIANPAPPAEPRPAPAPPAPTPTNADELEDEPTQFAAIGASIRLPKGSDVSRLSNEEFPAWQVLSPAGGPEWRLRVEQVWGPDAATDCGAQVKAGLAALTLGNTNVKMLSERDWKVSGCDARAVWASLTAADASRIAGLFVVRTGDGVFVSIATSMPTERFVEAEAILQRSFETLQVVDPRAIQLEREAAITRGQEFLKSLSKERLQALADGVSRVRRLWRQGADGEPEELGWVEVLMKRAPRSSAGRTGPSVLDKPSEREEGLLISLIARTTAADGTDRVETRANYWVAWDLGSEAWTVRSEQKGAGPKSRFEQVGLLPRGDGQQPPVLMVASDLGAGMEEPAIWPRPPVAYLPQAVALALGSMLPKDGTAPASMVFYALDPGSGRLCQRLVRWSRDETTPGAWKLEVQNTPDTPASLEWFDGEGRLLRRQEADGSRMDPSTPAEIERRWKAIGLDP
jgi:hypothetical protein